VQTALAAALPVALASVVVLKELGLGQEVAALLVALAIQVLGAALPVALALAWVVLLKVELGRGVGAALPVALALAWVVLLKVELGRGVVLQFGVRRLVVLLSLLLFQGRCP